MNQHWEELYGSLLKDLKKCKEKFNCLQKQIEQSFITCNHYWSIVRQEAALYEFETVKEEIHFFKHIKPKFTSQVEYYSLCYHGQLFKNEVSDPVKVKQFWMREALRLEKFIAENRDFYDYYTSERTDMDTALFTRNSSHKSSIYELDAKTVSSYDPLIATLLALKDYHEFVQKELQSA